MHRRRRRRRRRTGVGALKCSKESLIWKLESEGVSVAAEGVFEI
jgi:hypothetical protein